MNLALLADSGVPTFYVATNGSDAAPGTQSQPWQTLAHAVATAPSGSTIKLRGGTYRLSARLALNGKSFTFQAYPGETPIIDGGVDVSGSWTATGDGHGSYSRSLPNDTQDFWVNGCRRYMCRSSGGLANSPTETTTGYSFSTSNPISAYAQPARVQMVLNPHGGFWTSVVDVASMTATTITMASPQFTNARAAGGGSAGVPVWYRRARELLVSAGFFYPDTAGTTLYYIPLTGENLATASVIIGNLPKLIDATNCNLSFTGITFQHTTWITNPCADGWTGETQTAPVVQPPGAIEVHGGNLTLKNCTIQKVGGRCYAVDTGASCTVDGCRLDDAGTHHHFLGDPGGGGHLCGPMTVTNNYATGAGTLYNAPSALIQDGVFSLTMSGNELAHGSYMGSEEVGFAYTLPWNASDFLGKNRTISANLIHDFMGINTDGVLAQVGDGGLLYSYGAQGPTVANGATYTNNVSYGTQNNANGLYVDSLSANIVYSGNILWNIAGFELADPNGGTHGASVTGNFVQAGRVSDVDGIISGNTTGVGNFPAATIAAAGLPSAYQTLKYPGNLLHKCTFNTTLVNGSRVAAPAGLFVTDVVPETGNAFDLDLGNFSVVASATTPFSKLSISNLQGRAWVDIGQSNYTIQVTTSFTTALTLPQLIFRYQDGANYWQFGLRTLSGGVPKVALAEVKAGAQTVVASHTLLTGGYNAGQEYTLKVTTSGSVIQCYLNERLVLYYDTATDFETSTIVGFGTDDAGTGVATFWNFYASAPAGSVAAAPTYTFLDRFNDTDGTAISSHTPNTAPAGAWSSDSGSFIIKSLSLQGGESANTDNVAHYPGVAANGTLKVVKHVDPAQSSTTGDTDAILFRVQDTNNRLQVSVVPTSTGSTQPFQDVAGTFTSLNAAVSFPFTQGQCYGFRLVFNGTTVTLYVAGIQQWSITTSQFQTQTGIGLRTTIESGGGTAQPNGARWQSLSVQP